jgi:hypothetical protein
MIHVLHPEAKRGTEEKSSYREMDGLADYLSRLRLGKETSVVLLLVWIPLNPSLRSRFGTEMIPCCRALFLQYMRMQCGTRSLPYQGGYM